MPGALPEALPGALPRAVIVAGPTASGKSLLALHLAERLGGAVINADAMQCYRELRVLTARPTPEDERRAPHRLYGVLPGAQPGNARWWRERALDEMAAAHAAGLVPILCGGTGLYLEALVRGVASIPEPGQAAREEARSLLAQEGAAAVHARLAAADPTTAASLRPGDGQRVARAWEVWRGTGRGLAAWQADGGGSPAPWSFRLVLLDPPRPDLREAIVARFARMLAEGALDEVRGLLAQDLDPALPLMRAHGVPELAAYLRCEIALDEAARRAILATGQYTKRQATWFRHRSPVTDHNAYTIVARYRATEQLPERVWADLAHFVYGAA